MPLLRLLLLRLRALFPGDRRERELEEELSLHIELETEKNLRAGMSPTEARRQALIDFGGTERFKEQAREARRTRPLEDLARDLRYGLRRLTRTPGFALAVVLCLGVGLGATTGVFSFFFGIVLRPLPFAEADRLAVLFETAPGFTRASPSFADLQGWREQAKVFSGLGGYSRTSRTLSGGEGPEILEGARVTHDLFAILGARPHLGRGFTPEDDGPTSPPALLLSFGLWQERYGGRREALGTTAVLDDEPYTVVGVMPPGFAFPEEARFWVPLRTAATPEGGLLTAGLGRLRDGVTWEAARTDLARVSLLLQEAYPEANAQREVAVRPLEEDFLWGLKTPAALVLLVASFVLLLATANVANLLLAQGTVREREMVVRTALGAPRSRVVRQLLVEGLLLAVGGGGVGVALGVLGRNLYLSFLPEAFPYYLRFDLDLPALAILTGTTLLVGLLFALAPALETTRVDLLPDRLRSRSGGRRLRSALMAVQTGLALAVLVGAGVMAQSLARLRQVPLGLDPDRLLTLQVALSGPFREDAERQRAAFDEIRARVAALPGVTRGAVVSNLPVGGAAAGTSLYPEGTTALPPGQEPWVINKQVQPGYFGTMGIRLLSGRDFREEDGAGAAPPVVVVNESFARWAWPGENPLGRRIKYGRPESEFPWMEVVGVVGDVRHFGPDRPAEQGIYEPFRQFPWWREYLVVRTAGEPTELIPSVLAAVRAVDPAAPVYAARTMEEVLYRSYWRPVVLSRLLWIFSVVAVLLAILGVYGVVAFSTAQRTREFGVRMALGAGKRVILGEAFRQTILPCGVGMLVGLGLAVGGVRVASSLLYGVRALEPRVAVLSLLVLAVAVLVAAWLPARRAAALDPATVLRGE